MKFGLTAKPLDRELKFLDLAKPQAVGELAWLTLSSPLDMPSAVTLTGAASQFTLHSTLANVAQEQREFGSFALANDRFGQVVSTLGDQDLTFSTPDKSMLMEWDTGTCAWAASWASKPLVTPIGAVVQHVEVDPVAVATALRQLRFCLPESSELRIPGIRFDASAHTLAVHATNGTTFGMVTFQNDHEGPALFILPVVIVDLIQALLRDNGSDPLVLEFYPEHLRAVCGHRSLTVANRPSAVAFPPVERLVAACQSDVTISFPAAIARDAQRRAMAAAGNAEKNRTSRVQLRFGAGAFTIATKESFEQVCDYSGPDAAVVLNSVQFAGALDAMSGSTVTLAGGLGPHPWSLSDGVGAKFIIAPMRDL